MSVTVIAHFPVADIEKAITGLQDNGALLEEITGDAKAGGSSITPSLPARTKLVVIDEWKTKKQFESFFEGNAKIAKITELVGVTGLPAIAIYNEVEAPGKV